MSEQNSILQFGGNNYDKNNSSSSSQSSSADGTSGSNCVSPSIFDKRNPSLGIKPSFQFAQSSDTSTNRLNQSKSASFSAVSASTSTNSSSKIDSSLTVPGPKAREIENGYETSLSFHTISGMPQNAGQSFEELRYQDYKNGRRYGKVLGSSTFEKKNVSSQTNAIGVFGSNFEFSFDPSLFTSVSQGKPVLPAVSLSAAASSGNSMYDVSSNAIGIVSTPDRIDKQSVVYTYKINSKRLSLKKKKSSSESPPSSHKMVTYNACNARSSLVHDVAEMTPVSLNESDINDIAPSNVFFSHHTVRRFAMDRKGSVVKCVDSHNSSKSELKALTFSSSESLVDKAFKDGVMMMEPAEDLRKDSKTIDDGAETGTRQSSFDSIGLTSEFLMSASPAQRITRSDEDFVNENGYWMSPCKSKLQKMTIDNLKQVCNFRIGRKGFGSIKFLDPVDLSSFIINSGSKTSYNTTYINSHNGLVKKNKRSHLFQDSQIYDKVVIFVPKACALYPPSETFKNYGTFKGVERPLPGEGLNVNTIVSLEGVWAYSRETREPIKDPNHILYKMHLERLKKMPNHEFISFDRATGAWVFRTKPIR